MIGKKTERGFAESNFSQGFFSKGKKGFLGPIGDDLPSLIPLLFAFIIFFYAFTSAWNIFDRRNAAFSEDLAVLRISNSLRGNNYVAGFAQFSERCETAKATQKMNFLSGLLPLSTGGSQQFAGINTGKIISEDPGFFQEFECANSDKRPAEEDSLQVRYFPVALETKGENNRFFVKPMLLVVVAWK